LGDGFLKALGNPEGPHALACDLVGSMLAEWLGLSTFDFSVIEVTGDDEIPFTNGGRAAIGPAFISRAEEGFNWGGTEKELIAVVNPLEISGLVVLDTWTLNYDRYSPDGNRVNRDNVFLIHTLGEKSGLRIMAMDFTHAFRQGKDINRKVGFIEKIRDVKVYGLFPEFWRFLNRAEVRRLTAVLAGFTRANAEKIIREIPEAWEVDGSGRTALATLVTERAHFLGQNLETILWPQLEFEGGSE
jgi:hypothetical protein